MNRVDRQRVRSAFDRQASAYDEAAMVQKVVQERLLALLAAEGVRPGSLLDIGCGTGLLLERLGRLWPHTLMTGCDLAPGMCRAAAGRAGGDRFRLVCADCEQLPFADAAFDLVLSTSTFQWLESLCAAFAEARRVMAPAGLFVFALFGEGTLGELKESWQHALAGRGRDDDRLHRFPSVRQVEEGLRGAGFASCRVVAELERERYPDVPHLLRNLKRIGAGNASAVRGGGLGDRRPMVAMMEHYRQCYGDGEGIPATYEVIYGIAR
jgi:malonyl-CoA O-methyltransferase